MLTLWPVRSGPPLRRVNCLHLIGLGEWLLNSHCQCIQSVVCRMSQPKPFVVANSCLYTGGANRCQNHWAQFRNGEFVYANFEALVNGSIQCVLANNELFLSQVSELVSVLMQCTFTLSLSAPLWTISCRQVATLCLHCMRCQWPAMFRWRKPFG